MSAITLPIEIDEHNTEAINTIAPFNISLRLRCNFATIEPGNRNSAIYFIPGAPHSSDAELSDKSFRE